MMKGKAGYRLRRSEGQKLILAIVAVLLLMIGVTMVSQPSITVTTGLSRPNIPGIKTAEELQLERDWGPLAPVIKTFSDLGKALTGETESVGLEAELGYTSTTGESVVFMQKLSGVQVGFIGMSGIYVKPKLGDYKALKLYDHERGLEGQVWVKPAIRVKAYQGIPEEYAFNVKVKVKVDGETIHEKAFSKSGKGAPPSKIEFEKLAVPGKVFDLLLLGEKELARKILRGERPTGGFQIPNEAPKTMKREICFYADYQGVVKFEGDEEPIVKELKDVKLGCFSFEFKETGDFEMIVEKNVTVAPLAEVMASSGMEGLTPETTTTTITVTIPYTSYTTVIQGTTSTITQYQTYTLTKVKTRWKTTTVTTTVKVPEPYPVTTTVTKYVYVGGGGGGGSVLGNVTVITPDGEMPISYVKPGDLVLTEEGFKPVKQVKSIHVDNVYRITLEDGKVLLADDAQPVITTKGVKPVRDLEPGDMLATINGTSKITSIQRFDRKATVYDLVFEEPLNYYADGILVNDAFKYSGIILHYPYSEFIFIAGG